MKDSGPSHRRRVNATYCTGLLSRLQSLYMRYLSTQDGINSVSLFAFLTCSEGKSSFCLSLFINFVSHLHFYNKIHVFLKQIPQLFYSMLLKNGKKKRKFWASLVVQWLKSCLAMQGTPVRSLVWEDITCQGTSKPVHNY